MPCQTWKGSSLTRGPVHPLVKGRNPPMAPSFRSSLCLPGWVSCRGTGRQQGRPRPHLPSWVRSGARSRGPPLVLRQPRRGPARSLHRVEGSVLVWASLCPAVRKPGWAYRQKWSLFPGTRPTHPSEKTFLLFSLWEARQRRQDSPPGRCTSHVSSEAPDSSPAWRPPAIAPTTLDAAALPAKPRPGSGPLHALDSSF